MIVILLILLLVVPTFFLVPYFPYIIFTLIIGYLITMLRKGRNLRSIRKLAEKEEGENEIEIEIKKENETNFIERTTDTIFYILLSFGVSLFILYLFGDLSPLFSIVLLSTTVLCLLTAIYINYISPFYEDKKKWETHYKNFCKGYMDERYQEFLREERKMRKEEERVKT